MKKEPAFPTVDANTNAGDYGTPGMALRDYFAAKAMAAIISKSPFERGILGTTPDTTERAIALGAYVYADAMLDERENSK